MLMDKSLTMFLGGGLVVALVALVLFASSGQGTFGGDATQIPGRIATTSTIQLGPQENKIVFATSTNCTSRIVASKAVILMLNFTGAFGTSTLNGMDGHPQAASTTEVYDAGQFGCGTVVGFAYSSTTVNVEELR